MITQHSPPLRFKAVNIETGEEYRLGELQTHYQCVDKKTNAGFATTQTALFEFEGDIDSLVITQSTGLGDITEAEIFGGDVLADPGDEFSEDDITGELWEVVFFEGRHGVQHYGIANPDYMDLGKAIKYGFLVVGNRWQPSEELEKRAREVIAR